LSVNRSEVVSKLNHGNIYIVGSNSTIKKRYFHHTDDTFQDYPELIDRSLPSLDARQAILASAVPELAAAAASKAIAEWGRPASDVTHLVLATYSGAHMPGADVRLASLLGLRRTAQRTMAYFGGCAAGSAALRLAKDVAENNPGARVLVVCAELNLVQFRAPESDQSVDTLVIQALFGDGAAAVVVGAEDTNVNSAGNIHERPIFEMVSASQATIADSEDAAAGHLREDGIAFRPTPKLPALVRQHVERCLADAVAPLGLSGRWNDLFWAVHPGGPAILDGVEAGLALAPEKLAVSRHVLAEYGNLSGASIIFVLDELRRRREVLEDGGLGVMLGLGPGVSVETMVLRAMGGEEKRQ
jgi:bisdemethoxycurcumin synthase